MSTNGHVIATSDVGVLFPDTQDTVVPYVESGNIRDSAVGLADGRILYVFQESGAIKQGYATDETSFFKNGSVGSVTTALSGGFVDPHSCVFKTPSGDVYLVAHWSYRPSTGAAEILIYRSPSNLGGDWVLHGTVQTFPNAYNGGAVHGDRKHVGEPWISGSRWVLPAMRYVGGSSHGAREAVWLSTNAGVSWTLAHDVEYHIGSGVFGSGSGRNIGEFDGKLWWSSTNDITTDKCAFSTNQGSSWTNFTPPSTSSHNYVASDGTYLYDLRAGAVVVRSTNPTDNNSWVVFRDYPLNITVNPPGHIVQKLVNNWMISYRGRVIRARGRAGWVVGSVSMGGAGW